MQQVPLIGENQNTKEEYSNINMLLPSPFVC